MRVVSADAFRFNGAPIDVSDPGPWLNAAHASATAVAILLEQDERYQAAPTIILAAAMDGVVRLLAMAAYAADREARTMAAERGGWATKPAEFLPR